MQSPASQASFLTKHLDVWIQTDQALFDMRAWERCADSTLTLENNSMETVRDCGGSCVQDRFGGNGTAV